MAKKASKPKAQYAWVYSPTATAAEKIKISQEFESIVAQIKSKLSPVPEPQEYGQCVDIISRWKGNFFYIMQVYKYPSGKNYIKESAEFGLARLEFYGAGKFNMSYFRHTGQWVVTAQDVSTEDAKNSILNDPWFEIG